MKTSPAVSVALTLLFLAFGRAAFAQGVPQGQAVPAFRVITDEPYSAVRVTETVQTLANGSHITTKAGDEKIYRDSQGRMRMELYPSPDVINEDPSVPRSIIIRDPIAGASYTLNTKTHTAIVQHANFSSGPQNGSPVPRPAPQPPVRVNPSAPPPITVTAERLGTQMMEGVSVEGVRNTEVIPVGARGNDQPLNVVMERWFFYRTRRRRPYDNLRSSQWRQNYSVDEY